MRIAPAKPSDAPKLARILSDWIDEVPWMPKLHTPDEDRRYLAHLIATAEVWVLRGWRGPLGFLAQEGEDVHALYLRPGTRGQGQGKAMLDRAKAETAKITLWTFQQNLGARRFYAREGFHEVELTDGAGNDEKLPDVRLEWERAE